MSCCHLRIAVIAAVYRAACRAACHRCGGETPCGANDLHTVGDRRTNRTNQCP